MRTFTQFRKDSGLLTNTNNPINVIKKPLFVQSKPLLKNSSVREPQSLKNTSSAFGEHLGFRNDRPSERRPPTHSTQRRQIKLDPKHEIKDIGRITGAMIQKNMNNSSERQLKIITNTQSEPANAYQQDHKDSDFHKRGLYLNTKKLSVKNIEKTNTDVFFYKRPETHQNLRMESFNRKSIQHKEQANLLNENKIKIGRYSMGHNSNSATRKSEDGSPNIFSPIQADSEAHSFAKTRIQKRHSNNELSGFEQNLHTRTSSRPGPTAAGINMKEATAAITQENFGLQKSKRATSTGQTSRPIRSGTNTGVGNLFQGLNASNLNRIVSNGSNLSANKTIVNHIQTLVRNKNLNQGAQKHEEKVEKDFNSIDQSFTEFKEKQMRMGTSHGRRTNNFFSTQEQNDKKEPHIKTNLISEKALNKNVPHTQTNSNLNQTKVSDKYFANFAPSIPQKKVVVKHHQNSGEIASGEHGISSDLIKTAIAQTFNQKPVKGITAPHQDKATLQPVHTSPSRRDSIETKIKHNKETFKQYQQQLLTGKYPGQHKQQSPERQVVLQRHHAVLKANRERAQSMNMGQPGSLFKTEFATPGCSDINVYHFGRTIGTGAYAVVKEALHRHTGDKVAIKQYDRNKLLDIHRKKQAIREIRILSRLNHHGIVRLVEAIDAQKYVYLVMEYVQGESLHAHLKATTQRRFTEEKAKRVIKQLLTILAYLHQRNVSHRDIKLENIIIDKRGQIKLIDFGFCCCSSPDIKLKIFCGTPSYMCPEIAMKREYLGPPTDIWASGILLFAMLCGQFPFRGSNDKELYQKIGRGIFDYPEHLSSQAKMFMSKMLLVDPGSRHTAEKLLLDPFLSGSQFQTSDHFLSTNESSGLNAYSKSLNNNSPQFDNIGRTRLH